MDCAGFADALWDSLPGGSVPDCARLLTLSIRHVTYAISAVVRVGALDERNVQTVALNVHAGEVDNAVAAVRIARDSVFEPRFNRCFFASQF